VREGSDAAAPPTTQTGTLASSSFDPPSQSPEIPILIGLALTAAIVAGTRWLARRNDW